MRRYPIRAALLVGGLASLAALPASHPEARTDTSRQETQLAIRQVSVIPMDTERVLPDQTVVIEGATIVRSGPSDQVVVPSGARVIDGSGKFLLPGLFDMHVHINRSEREHHLALYLANGVTTVQNMSGSPWHLELRQRVADGELVGPRILTTGPTTASEGLSTPAGADRLVREQKATGYDAIKQYGVGSEAPEETYERLLAAAREAGMRVVGHAPRNLPFSAVLEGGQSSVDHAEEIVYTYQPIVELFRTPLDIQSGRARPEDHPDTLDSMPDPRELEPAIEELARRMKKAGTALTPTLVAFGTIQAQTTSAFDDLQKIPELGYMSPLTRVQWGPGFNRYRQGWSDRLEVMAEVLDASYRIQEQIVRELHAAGVPIMTGTDATLTYVIPGFSLHDELQRLVAVGLSPYESLRAATIVPARYLGMEGRSGVVAEGARADLVLVDGNPLTDISNAQRIAGVVAAGRWLPRGRLEALLEELAAAYAPLSRRIEPIVASLREGRAEEALQAYAELDTDDPELARFVEGAVNSLGYDLLNADRVDDAIAVFTLNTEYFPDAFNTWDSLGEAYMVKGDDESAIRYYERSLELNPDNTNAERMLEKIRER